MIIKQKLEALEVDEHMKQASVGLAIKHWKSVYSAAKHMGMSKSTLGCQVNRGKSCTEARESQQKLTCIKEKVLIEWIQHLTVTEHLARHFFIWELADEIKAQWDSARNVSFYTPLSASWSWQFINCHTYLKTVISHSIKASHIKDVTKEVILTFFEAFECCIEEYQITLNNIYNMNEMDTVLIKRKLMIGFTIGTAQTSYVIVNSRLWQKYQAQSEY